MTKRSDNILKKIKEEKVNPTPKWKFILKDYILWSVFGFLVFIGGFASSVVFYLIINDDWDVYSSTGKSLFEYILLALPYFWLVLFILFIGLAYINFKYTRKSYRYHPGVIIVISVLGSVVLGLFFYSIGFGHQIDNILSERVPAYERMKLHYQEVWNNPESGLLIGWIKEYNTESFELKAIDGKKWTIITTNLSKIERKGLVEGRPVRIIGVMKDDDTFYAKELRRAPDPRFHRPMFKKIQEKTIIEHEKWQKEKK